MPAQPSAPSIVPKPMPAALRYFPWFVLLLAAFTIFKVTADKPVGLRLQIREDGKIERIAIQDFASHLVFSKEVWHSGARYDVDSHLAVAQKWAGAPIKVALPFGYSPTMAIVLGPLTFFDLESAYLLWSAAALIACGWIIYQVGIAGSVAFISPLALSGLVLGQTAFLTMAAFLAISLFLQTNQTLRSPGFFRDLATGALVWILTAKPPIAAAAFLTLACLREWRALTMGVFLTVLGFAFMTPKFGGSHWVFDYLSMIRRYNTVEADLPFAWSLHPETMTNLRGLLTVLFHVPDNTSANASSFCWLGSMVLAFLWTFVRKGSVSWACSISLLTYLLFCPHLTSTEDLHLVLLLPFASWLYPPANFAGRRSQFLNSFQFPILILVLIFVNPATTKWTACIAVVFVGKLFLLALWARSAGTTKTDTELTAKYADERIP